MLKKAIFLLIALLLALALIACGETAPQGDGTPDTPDTGTSGNGSGSGNSSVNGSQQTSKVYDWNFLSNEGLDKNKMTEDEINALLERQQFRWEMSDKGVLTLKGVCVNAPTFADELDQPWRGFTTLQSNDAGDGRPVLKHVVVESTVMELPDYAFTNCAELETVTLPLTLSELPPYCFAGCEALTTVTGGMGIQRIHDYALSNCSVLQRIELTDTLTEVGYCAFERSCDKLGYDNVSGEKKYLLIYFRGTEETWTAVIDKMTAEQTLSPIGNSAFTDAVILYVEI